MVYLGICLGAAIAVFPSDLKYSNALIEVTINNTGIIERK